MAITPCHATRRHPARSGVTALGLVAVALGACSSEPADEPAADAPPACPAESQATTLEVDLAASPSRSLPPELVGNWGAKCLPSNTSAQCNALWDALADTHTYIVDLNVIGSGSTPPYFPDFSKDPLLASSYAFQAIDGEIHAAHDRGYAIQFSVSDLAYSPPDLATYGTVVKQLMRHLVEGWPNGAGFNLTADELRLVIYGNEPDLPFWQGTPAEFRAVYATFAAAVKEVAPWVPVGAPAFANPVDYVGATGSSAALGATAQTFLEAVEADGVPLDFFAWHHYSFVPASFANWTGVLAGALEGHQSLSPLYGTPRLANDEWNLRIGYGLGSNTFHEQLANTWGAAANLSSLVGMIANGLDASTPAVGIGGAVGATSTIDRDFTITDSQGDRRPGYYMLEALSEILAAPELRFARIDADGFAALVTSDADARRLVILLSNYNVWRYIATYAEDATSSARMVAEAGRYGEAPADLASAPVHECVQIRLRNPGALGGGASYERYVVDDANPLALAESGPVAVSGGDVLLAAPLGHPQIQLLVITAP